MSPPTSLLLPLLLLSSSSLVAAADPSSIPHLFDPLIPTKLNATYLKQPSPPSKFPQYTNRNGSEWLYFSLPTWTSGFFPASLYALHERASLCPSLSIDPDVWLSLARASSTGELALLNMSGLDHDVGFLSYPFMDEVRVNPSNATAVQAIQTLASDLAARFDPDVGCTRSWDQTTVPNGFEVIIDNMMNLELFFFANDLSPNQTMVDMATSHANKTAANHFRSDGGTFHVVEYDETNGAVLGQFTSQGYSNSSTWSRGQSWAIYGFANMYARTNIQLYLDTARHAASYWLAHTPSSGIIPWDFDAPSGPDVADTSAAMVAANGFLLLADQEVKVGNSSGKQLYEDAAAGLLNVHATQFWKEDWASLFSNGTVNNPAGNNLTGIVYGDYFFIRAGNELVKRNLTTC